MTDLACRISGIDKAFGENRVLRKLSLDLPAGTVTALMGANGAGKSTLVKILSGVHARDAGTITLMGEPFAPATPSRAIRAGVVTVHQNINDGVIPDLNYDSSREPVRATVFVSGNAEFVENSLGSAPNLPNFTLMLLRLDPGNLEAGLASLKAAQETIRPEGSLNSIFLAQHLLALYESDLRRRELLTWAAGLAILLAAMGLYAKAGQAAALRTREVAMRKVSGAQIVHILRLLLWQFTKPVVLANLIAWPVAGWLMHRWLEGFEYRIELTLWPFLLAGAAALAIALLTVSGHALRVARTHPALALREE